jgi:ferredoxin, 2Fe-2S
VNRQLDIRITVIIQGEKFPVTTFKGEYRNLMMLLYDKFYLDGFGECKGIGRCGTCHIQIADCNRELLRKVGNENSTLSKMTGVANNSRLACQMDINEELDGSIIEIIS